jgi:hypothetical protein
MDTSKEYIEMCEAAEEIQELEFIRDENSSFFDGDSFENGGYQIWLPRQDQLQEILGIGNFSTVGLIDAFRVEIFNFYRDKYTSFEQLWLQFVMKRIYNKIWNSETKNWDSVQ